MVVAKELKRLKASYETTRDKEELKKLRARTTKVANVIVVD